MQQIVAFFKYVGKLFFVVVDYARRSKKTDKILQIGAAKKYA